VSKGDQVNETIAVSCDASTQEMIVKAVYVNRAHMEMNEIPKGYELQRRSCDFLANTKAKVELHEGTASARGQCGANPPIKIEITNAKGKQLELDFSPRCGGLLIKSVAIHRDYVKVCRYTEVNHKAPWVEERFASEPEHVCQTY
jgi:Zn-finger nucleic acid-binding protein